VDEKEGKGKERMVREMDGGDVRESEINV